MTCGSVVSWRSRFALAVNEARRRRHEFLCIEHLLYALLHDDDVAEILRQCGGDVAALKRVAGALPRREAREAARRRRHGAAADDRLPARHPARRGARAVGGQGRDPRPQRPGGDLPRAGFPRRVPARAAGHHAPRRGELHLPRRLEDRARSRGSATATTPRATPTRTRQARPKKDPLALFTTDLVARAAAGKIDPLIGRETELARTARVLCRRRKNNPVFVGEAGVGKTALAEGLALQIHQGKVPRGAEGRARLRPRHGGAAGGHALPRRLRATPERRAGGAAASIRARSCSSTRSTPWSAPARPAAARSMRRTS